MLKRTSTQVPKLALLLLLAGGSWNGAAASDNWPQWRGPNGTGEAAGNPPIEWSEDENILWKTPLPGLGISTPVLWEDLIALTSAVDTGRDPSGKTSDPDRSGRRPGNIHDWIVVGYDRATGEERWRTKVATGVPHEGDHMHSTWASNSPVTDGERIYAYFGSMGLYALDLTGEIVWERKFGTMLKSNEFGEGASPALHDGKLIVQWDHEGDSFIVALEARTGSEIWRKEREENSTWSTPLIVDTERGAQVITNATANIRSYDLDTGELLWWTTGMTENVIPSPVAADGVVYAMSGFMGYALVAVDLDLAEGDITGTPAVLWTYDRDTPYVASPLLYRDKLYFFKSLTPILTAFDVKEGKPAYGPLRMEELGNAYASPVGAAGRVYFFGRKGAGIVIDAGDEYEILAVNQLDDSFDASPIVADDVLYLRGRKSLYAIGHQASN